MLERGALFADLGDPLHRDADHPAAVAGEVRIVLPHPAAGQGHLREIGALFGLRLRGERRVGVPDALDGGVLSDGALDERSLAALKDLGERRLLKAGLDVERPADLAVVGELREAERILAVRVDEHALKEYAAVVVGGKAPDDGAQPLGRRAVPNAHHLPRCCPSPA